MLSLLSMLLLCELFGWKVRVVEDFLWLAEWRLIKVGFLYIKNRIIVCSGLKIRNTTEILLNKLLLLRI
jgi:hypothetical protein